MVEAAETLPAASRLKAETFLAPKPVESMKVVGGLATQAGSLAPGAVVPATRAHLVMPEVASAPVMVTLMARVPLLAGAVRETVGAVMSMTVLAELPAETVPFLSLAQMYSVRVPSPAVKVKLVGLLMFQLGLPGSGVVGLSERK